MAEIAANIRDGITREIRFVEYKLRKRQTDKHKKSKNKNKHKQVEDTTAVRDFQSSFSDDVAKAVPSSLGEEDLQLKVALAISKEEAEAAQKQAVSDKLRLEMALKESATAAEVVAEKVKTAQTPSPTTSAPKDPWAAPSSSSSWEAPSAAPQSSFDPFGAPSASASNGFTDDLWTAQPTSSNTASTKQLDPWAQSSSLRLTPPAPSPTKQTPSPSFDSTFDVFGDSKPLEVTPTAIDPWATTPANSAAQAAAPQAVFDPFAAPDQHSPVETFDPMAEFDNLRVSSSSSTQQLPPNHYSLNMNMLMTPVNVQQNSEPLQVNPQSTNTPTKGNDLDNLFGGLVDLTPNKPKLRSSNPFDQKKPSLSLNQLKGESQPNGFDDLATIQRPSNVSSMPTVAPNMNYGMMQMPGVFSPPAYHGLQVNNNNAYPPMAGIPQNQSLF